MDGIGSDLGFSAAAVSVLHGVLESLTTEPEMPEVRAAQLLRYLAGRSLPEEAELVERAAVEAPGVRLQLVEILDELNRFQETPYGNLVSLASSTEASNENLAGWLDIVDSHVETVSTNLHGAIPTTWPALARLAKQGVEGFISARTIWRALFAVPGLEAAAAPVQLGFGYRRGTSATVEPVQLFTHLQGVVRSDGALEIEASTELGPLEGAVFFAFSMNGRALPLAEASIKRGRVSVVVEGLAGFLRLPVGPIPANTLAARLDDWPEDCKLGQLIVRPGKAPMPLLEMPVVRDGELVLVGFFEDLRMEGAWQLLLASTPNTWQMLAEFDIKCLIERPQALKARMPKAAKGGPFGGALLLRRCEPGQI